MNAETFEATNDEYHASPGVSNSMFKDFLPPNAPALYAGRHVFKTIPKKTSSAMEIGSQFHEYMLEAGRVIEIPEDVLAIDGKKAGKPWHAFRSENAGKTLLKASELVDFKGMRESLLAEPKARAILEGGETETNIRWTDDETGLLLRARLDKMHDIVIADLKTTTSVHSEKFAVDTLRFGYHRQTVWYAEAVEELTGELLPFVFVAVEKSPPYSVQVIELGDTFTEIAKEQITKYRPLLAKCLETGVWELPTHGIIITVEPPRWAAYQDEWEV